MIVKTWVMAGLSVVCKTMREGFDSLPRLQIYINRVNRKRFPENYSNKDLNKLVLYHHEEHVKWKTSYTDLMDKHIKLSKELSIIKRRLGKVKQ